jgi:hypothetical protein
MNLWIFYLRSGGNNKKAMLFKKRLLLEELEHFQRVQVAPLDIIHTMSMRFCRLQDRRDGTER